MPWLIAALCSLAAAGCLWRLRQWRCDARVMEDALDDLLAGKVPDGAALRGNFASLARKVEMLRERAARELGRQEDYLRIILGSMEDGVMVADHNLVITMANAAARQLFDLRGDPRGRTVLEALRDPSFSQLMTTAREAREPVSGEVRIDRPCRHFAIRVAPLVWDGRDHGVVAIIRDISPLKRAEEMRRDLVANVSHELRTPLSIFQGYLENLLDEPEMPRAEIAESLQIMEKHSQRLHQLSEDLLTLARLEAEGATVEKEPVDVGRLFGELVRDWSRAAEKQGVTLLTNVPADFPALPANEPQLIQIGNNLIENALKFTEGGAITLAARAVADGIELRFEDTGAGIPPADLPHIFERFYRADKARTRKQGGTGLGLAIVKHIVLTHGGTVAAESVLNEGTAIILRFPASDLSDIGRDTIVTKAP